MAFSEAERLAKAIQFYVDGNWRYDEHQPFVSGAYGIANTVLVGREGDIPNNTFQADIPGNMEVDEAITHPILPPDGLVQERISETDVHVSHTAYELLPESGKVWRIILLCPSLFTSQIPDIKRTSL